MEPEFLLRGHEHMREARLVRKSEIQLSSDLVRWHL